MAKYGGGKITEAARAGLLRRFELQVDPEGVLEPGERQKRAQAAMRAHMTVLALKNSLARAKSRPEVFSG